MTGIFEVAYGQAMRKLCREEGKRGKMPKNNSANGKPIGRPARSDVTVAIMEVLHDEMAPGAIASAVSKRLGRQIHTQSVSDKLRGTLTESGEVMCRNVGPMKNLWRAAL